jgi:hypothetical protein
VNSFAALRLCVRSFFLPAFSRLFAALVASFRDPNHLSCQTDNLRQSLVDSDGEGIEVRVRRAKDHPTMGVAGTMQLAEMLAIV